jgi:hypothetical protein
LVSDLVPVAASAPTARTTNESDAAIAGHGWRMLQRPIVPTDLMDRV